MCENLDRGEGVAWLRLCVVCNIALGAGCLGRGKMNSNRIKKNT